MISLVHDLLARLCKKFLVEPCLAAVRVNRVAARAKQLVVRLDGLVGPPRGREQVDMDLDQRHLALSCLLHPVSEVSDNQQERNAVLKRLPVDLL